MMQRYGILLYQCAPGMYQVFDNAVSEIPSELHKPPVRTRFFNGNE